MRSVLITGASRGIGAACAKAFAYDGYRVYINYNKSRNDAVALEASLNKAGFSAVAICADVTKPDEVSRLISLTEYHGGLDVLVNNAGVSFTGTFEQTDAEIWNNIIGTNVTGVYNVTKRALPLIKASASGRIINISSVWGVYGASCEVAYSTSKAAVIGFTKSLASELGPSGVTVNCIAPGYIDTDMNASHGKETVLGVIERTPLCRIGAPDDIAGAAVFLASEKSGFITGQILGIDGGFR